MGATPGKSADHADDAPCPGTCGTGILGGMTAVMAGDGVGGNEGARVGQAVPVVAGADPALPLAPLLFFLSSDLALV